MSRDDIDGALYVRTDADAARHLFRVAAGLDSLVVGEPEILGQVKDAYKVASEARGTGSVINRLFHGAFAIGKRVRTDTGLSEGAVSLSYAAVTLAAQDLRRPAKAPLRGLRCGRDGATQRPALPRARGEHDDRHAATGSRRGAGGEVHGHVVAWDERFDALAAADILVSATGSPTISCVTEADMRRVLAGPARPPDVRRRPGGAARRRSGSGRLEEVFLYNIDDLRGIVQENLARRQDAVAKAERLVNDEVAAWYGWLRSRAAIPTVVALRTRFERVRQAELDRLAPRLAGLGPDARARVDEITRLMVEKLLLTPTEQLKAIDDHETMDACSAALRRLFALDDDAAAHEADRPDTTATPDGHGPMTTTWRIGTRGSALALWQANTVKARLEALGVAPCEIVVIKTDGDRLQDAPLSDIGGKRLFVKEIEDALLDGEIDLAVHSAKDMAVVLPAGLHIAGVLPRADPRDAVVLPEARGIVGREPAAVCSRSLGTTPRIGTSSVRRVAQLHRQFPGAEFLPVRGNVDTRLRKLDAGDYDALVLAAAGLHRLDRGGRISGCLPVDACIPAPGQGIVAVECREDAERSDPDARRDERRGGRCRACAWSARSSRRSAAAASCRSARTAAATEDGGLELIACVTSIESDHEVRALGFGDDAGSRGAGRTGRRATDRRRRGRHPRRRPRVRRAAAAARCEGQGTGRVTRASACQAPADLRCPDACTAA